jgi:hypothetical protein
MTEKKSYGVMNNHGIRFTIFANTNDKDLNKTVLLKPRYASFYFNSLENN